MLMDEDKGLCEEGNDGVKNYLEKKHFNCPQVPSHELSLLVRKP